MKYLKFKLFAFFIALTALSACSENECSASAFGIITAVTGPEITETNEEITFNVSFKLPNTCAGFGGFAQSNSYPKEIIVNIQYEGCSCAAQNVTGTEEYLFSTSEPGEYELKFLSNENTYITKTVTVSEPE